MLNILLGMIVVKSDYILLNYLTDIFKILDLYVQEKEVQ